MHWSQFLQQLTAFLSATSLLPPGARVLVAVSGGIDSVVLLAALAALRETLELSELAAVYVDHGLRPEQTPEEARWVTELARNHGLRCFVRKIQVNVTNGSVQAAARQARRESLERLIEEESLDWIATGHHADDQAETLLLRLLRGTGPQGLAGIAAQQGRWVRPLLPFYRSELLAVAQERQMTWLEDPSNTSFRFTRNRIRHELIPMLEQIYNPRLRHHLNDLAVQAQHDEAYLEAQLDSFWTADLVQETTLGWCIQLQTWDTLPQPLQWRALRRLVRSVSGGHDLTRQHLTALMQLAQHRHGEQTISLPPPLQAVRRYHQLYLRIQKAGWESTRNSELGMRDRSRASRSPKGVEAGADTTRNANTFSVCLEGPGRYVCPVGVLEVEVWSGGQSKPSSQSPFWEVYLAKEETAEFPWTLRNRRPGDRLDFGSHHRPLKKWMIDAKIPRSFRFDIPLLERAGTIGWVVGWQPLPPFQLQPPSQGWCLRFLPDTPVIFQSAVTENLE